jgi:hypothetical protein
MNTRTIIGILSLALLASGCAYHGKLRNDFYHPGNSGAKLPLKCVLVYGRSWEASQYDAEDVYFAHSVHIGTHPAMKEALTAVCGTAFDRVMVVDTAAACSNGEADVVMVPKMEMRESALYLTLTAKSGRSGETLAQYEGSGNVVLSVPASVHLMGAVNGGFCCLLSPVITPAITKSLGHRGEKALSETLATCLNQVSEELRNDTALASRVRTTLAQSR